MRGSLRKVFACAIAMQLCMAFMPAAAMGATESASEVDRSDTSGVADVEVCVQESETSNGMIGDPRSGVEDCERQALSGGVDVPDPPVSSANPMSLLATDDEPSKISASVHASQTWVALLAKGGVFDQANAVKFPVWSQVGGQDDLVWYDARHDPDGSWAAAVDISRHASAGIYDVHAYAVVGDSMVGVGSTQFTIDSPSASVTLDRVDNGSYQIKVSGISSPSGVSAVRIPSWTADGGQDDIVWHDASLSGDAWYGTVSANMHGGQDGIYDSHVYVTGNNGVSSCVGAERVDVKCENYIYITGALGSGKRTVYVKNPSSTVIYMPTWSEAGGQDDIVWYPAAFLGNQLWGATIDCYSLKHTGRVITHVYSNNEFAGEMLFDVTADDIMPAMYRDMYNRVQGLASSSHLLVAADTNNCFVGIYQGSIGNWSPVAYFPCSPGAYGSPSRKGIFTVGSKGYAFGTSSYTCYYYTQYSGNYLFHSVLYYPGTRTVKDGRLGMHLSHGCVRLAIDNAKWIYDNVPSGSRVLVY